MNSFSVKILIIGALILMTKVSLASDEVIASQDFISISSYQEKDTFPTQDKIDSALSMQKEKIEDKKINSDNLANNKTSEFSEGMVKEHRLNMDHALAPFFIIGNDKDSLIWAKKNQQYFQSIHAVGLIVGANSIEEVSDLEKQVNLPLVPANLSDLSKVIETNHYPVLIHNNWVTQ